MGSEILVLAGSHHGRWQNHMACWACGFVDDNGVSLAGNFDAQVREAFKNLENGQAVR